MERKRLEQVRTVRKRLKGWSRLEQVPRRYRQVSLILTRGKLEQVGTVGTGRNRLTRM
jgi:hypothetical protein